MIMLQKLFDEFNRIPLAKDKVAFLKDPKNIQILQGYNINLERITHEWEWIAGLRTDDYRGL